MENRNVDEISNKKARIVKSHDISLNGAYVEWIHELKDRYRGTQIKAAIKVNSEQLLFNWQLGRDLVVKDADREWGSGVVEQLSMDLQNEFPKAKGFSARNIWNMKKWYSFYACEEEGRSLIDKANTQVTLDSIKLHQVGAEIKECEFTEKLHQAGAEMEFPPIFGFVPWRHHVEIVTKCKTVEEALFYVKKTIEDGLSRSALINCIEADLFHKAGGVITNYEKKLPIIQGKLAQEITKENYDLGFISLPPEYDEADLEDALEKNITDFLLELGRGFAFVGRQKEIIVAGKTRKIDMLFYHINLRCYIVVDLKVVPFDPEFVGKMNFYVNAVNEILRTEDDNPTIGLIICRGMNKTEVQWAFEGLQTPMGVATYNNVQLKAISEKLPSAEEIQKRLEQAEAEFLLNKKNRNDNEAKR